MKAINKCRWHVEIKSCYDVEREQTVWYWECVQIEGECGLTQDGLSMPAVTNLEKKEDAVEAWTDFANKNGIPKFNIHGKG